MKKIIVVTGGAGFVGSNLIKYFVANTKYKILSIDNYFSGSKKNHILNKKIKYLILDKRFLDNKKVQLMSKEKYYYTIKTKKEFFKYNKNNNLIFENL